MIDISSVKSKEKRKAGKFWLVVVDETTRMKWSFFLSTKFAQVPLLIGFIKTPTEQGKQVKFIWCDNAAENGHYKIVKLIGIEFEARATNSEIKTTVRSARSEYIHKTLH